MSELPTPSAEQRQIHLELLGLIFGEIERRGGIDFCRYMQRCLYEPRLGYYQNSFQKLGRDGDFTTAAEMSADFAGCLAVQIAQLPGVISGAAILEFGGGTGQFACDLLLTLQHLEVLPANYFLLDVSVDLRARQRVAVQNQLPADLRERVVWLEELPTAMHGVVLANELFDAFPVERFRIEQGAALREYVTRQRGELGREYRADPTIDARVRALQAYNGRPFADGYESEYCPMLGPWWAALGDVLQTGVVLASDYGRDRSAYYSDRRSGGSLRCFYRHMVHDDPMLYQGIQDITADVDFTAVTEAATAAGFELQGYCPLSQFMLSLRALEHFEEGQRKRDTIGQLSASGQLKRLLLPEEMGERFKMIGFSKGLESALQGFSMADHSRLL